MKNKLSGLPIVSGLLGLLVLSGCVTQQATVQDRAPGSGNVYQTQQNGSIALVSNKTDRLQLRVLKKGQSSEEKQLAASVEQSMRESLSRLAKLHTGKDVDAELSISPKLTLLDKMGEYVKMKGRLHLELKPMGSDRVYAAHTIQLPAQRKLGKSAVIESLSEVAMDEAASWSREELRKMVEEEIGVAMLTVRLPQYLLPNHPDRDVERTKKIGDKLAGMRDLLSCHYVGLDDTQKFCIYRVAYFKAAYPNGFVNEASVLLSSK